MAYRISHEGVPEKEYLEHHRVGQGEGGLSNHEREKIKIIIGPHLHKLCTLPLDCFRICHCLGTKATHSGRNLFW